MMKEEHFMRKMWLEQWGGHLRKQELNYQYRTTLKTTMRIPRTLYLRKKFVRIDCNDNGKIKMFENI